MASRPAIARVADEVVPTAVAFNQKDSSMTHRESNLRAFERLTRQIANLDESGWRLARFAPPPSLPLATLWLPDRETGVPGEVLDLSAGGIRVAVHEGIRIQPGGSCQVEVILESSESHRLSGVVHRVEPFKLITLLVVVPETDRAEG